MGLGRACLTATDESAQWLASLHPKRDERQTLRDSLAALHVQGAAIDWRAVTAEGGGRKIALPHYPFERQRYWVQATSPSRNGRAASAGGHPLLGEPWESAAAPDWRQYEATLSPGAPAYLAEHRLFGTAVLPGVAYLEMALAAAGEQPTAWRLMDVAWQQPLGLGVGRSGTSGADGAEARRRDGLALGGLQPRGGRAKQRGLAAARRGPLDAR